MFETRVTRLLSIKYPIIQGGMQWVARAELAAAVSNAGGLGIISALTFASPEALAKEIRKAKELTDSPFGVNLTLLPSLRPRNLEDYVNVIVGEGVRIVETAGRNPESYLGPLKAARVKIIHKCTAVRFARTAERIGCDVISIDGFECAGHPGEEDVTSLVLVPATTDAVKVPVIASGGFGDARGFVAALALGAEGVNMGTRFLMTREAPVHAKVKEWLVRATERDTMFIQRSLRNTDRVIRNPTAEKVLEMEKRGATIEELAPLVTGERGRRLQETGDIDDGIMSAGQVVGLLHDIPTVKEVMESIVTGAEAIISRRLAALAGR